MYRHEKYFGRLKIKKISLDDLYNNTVHFCGLFNNKILTMMSIEYHFINNIYFNFDNVNNINVSYNIVYLKLKQK